MSRQARHWSRTSGGFAVLLSIALVGAAGCKRVPQKQPIPGAPEWVADAIPSPDPKAEIRAIAGTGADDVWAVGFGIFHYDGSTWRDATTPELHGMGTALNAISVVARDDVWAVGVNGRVAHYDGTTWHGEQLPLARVSKDPDVKGYFNLIDVVAWKEEVWVTASQGRYYRFDRKSWSVVEVPELAPRTFQQVWGATPKDVWLVGGRMDHFDGARWGTHSIQPAGLRWARGTSVDDVWAVGWKGNHKDDDGALFHFDGKTWSDVVLPPGTPLLWAVHASKPNRAYAVGDKGWALELDGRTWRPIATGESRTLWGIYVTDGAAFAVGDIGPRVLRRVTPRPAN